MKLTFQFNYYIPESQTRKDPELNFSSFPATTQRAIFHLKKKINIKPKV
jgi:hypothetical protein